MNRQRSLWIWIALVASVLLAACGAPQVSPDTGAVSGSPTSGTTSAAGTQQPVTIRFFHVWPEPENMAYFNALIERFQAENPNIKVEMEAIADNPYKDKIRVMMASGEVPDIYFSWAGEFAWKFARGGQALDLTDAFYNSDWKDSIIPGAVEPFKWEGKLYGVPLRISAKFMAYNKAMFNQLGLSEPTTWDEFLAVSEKLKQAGITPIAYGNEAPWAASHYIGTFNAQLVPNETRKADYALTSNPDQLFTDPGYVEALQRYQTLMDKGYFNASPNALSHSVARSSFIAGKAGMMYIQMEELAALAQSELGQEGFGIFQLPGNPTDKGDQKLLTGAPDGFVVSSKTKNPDAAIKFLKFLTSPENGKAFVKQTGVPSASIDSVNAETALPIVVKGVDAFKNASGLALWLDTDMNIKVVETYLPGTQALLSGSTTPDALMGQIREAAIAAQKDVQSQP